MCYNFPLSGFHISQHLFQLFDVWKPRFLPLCFVGFAVHRLVIITERVSVRITMV